ncbi:MAG: GspH/FimT family protein [Planctomycetota bacterium]
MVTKPAAVRAVRRGGFSLLELLLVLVGITVLAALSIWAFFARGEVTLENAARLLVEDLHMAQSRALFLRAPVEVRFDDDGSGYHVHDSTGKSSGFEALDFLGRRYDVDAVFEGVSVQTVEGGTGRVVRFDAKGETREKVWITLGYRGETRTVEIERGDGVAVVVDAKR